MKKSEKYVSWELILAGRGFLTLHEFLNPSVRHAIFEEAVEDPAPEITEVAPRRFVPGVRRSARPLCHALWCRRLGTWH